MTQDERWNTYGYRLMNHGVGWFMVHNIWFTINNKS